MARGERIGDAYIRIHADGSGFDESIRRDFDPVIRTAGKNNAKTYSQAFTEELERRGPARAWINMSADINRAFGRFDAGSQWIDDFEGRLDGFREMVSKRFGPQIGERLSQEIRDAMQRGFINTQEDFDNFTRDLRPAVTRLTQVIDEENERALSKMVEEQKRRLVELERAEAETSQEIISIKQKENLSIIGMFRDRIDAEARAIKQSEQAREKERKGLLNLQKEYEELTERISKYARGAALAGENQAHLTNEIDRMRISMREAGLNTRETDREFRRLTRTMITASPRLGHYDDRWGKLSRTLGGFFGHGSRNDFLNIVGRSVTGLLTVTGRVITGLFRLGSVAKRSFDLLSTGASEGFKSFGTASRTLVEGLAQGAAGLAAFAALLAVMGAAMAVLTTAATGLAIVLGALVSTLALAAAGIAPLLGLLGPLAAGLGVVAAAYLSLSDAQKEALGNDLQPLTDSFRSLADAAGEVLFQDVAEWARTLAPIVQSLEPAVVGVAEAIRDTLGDAISSAAESDGFQRFIDRISTFLPNAVGKLGEVFTNTFEGLGGFFVAMIPAMNRLLGFLIDITDQFSDWINSTTGQKAVREFFREVGEAAGAVAEFIGAATVAVGELIRELAAGAGNEFFLNMADTLRDITGYLTNPANRETIEEYMTFGREFGKALGDLVIAANDFVSAMNTESTRTAALFLVDAFSEILGFLEKYPEAMALLLGPLGLTIVAVQKLVDLFGFLNQPFGESGLADFLNAISFNFVPGLSKTLGFVGDIKDAIFGGGEKEPFLQEALEGIAGTSLELEGLIGTLDQVTGKITQATREFIALELVESDLDTAGKELGLSLRTLVDASLGNRRASNQVSQALFDQWKRTGELTAEQQALWEALGHTTEELNKGRTQILTNSQAITDFTGKLKGIPKDVRFEIKESGIVPTTKGIADVVAAAKELAPDLNRRQIKTIIEASGVEATNKRLRAVLEQVNELDGKKGTAEADLDRADFEARMREVDKSLRDTDRKKTAPDALLDNRQFLQDRQKLLGDLSALDREEATPKASINTAQFYADRAQIISGLNTIPDENVYVNIINRRVGGSTGGDPNDTSGGQAPDRGRAIVVPSITINDSGDPTATVQELLNRLVATGY